ncbi:MAG TPA: hypothetical protein VMV49_17965 [Candidatus Deferrimicrobium sp.]|nr:hypothetical protein [Candidatus Deferrimicrobium sp.]
MSNSKISKEKIARYYEGISLERVLIPDRDIVHDHFMKYIVYDRIINGEVGDIFYGTGEIYSKAFLYESTILFERALSNFLAGKYLFMGGHLNPGYICYYYSDLNAIMGISHILGHGIYFIEGGFGGRKIGKYHVKRINWDERKYEIKKDKSKSTFYKQKYEVFFELVSHLNKREYTKEEQETFEKNRYTKFFEDRNAFAYSLQASTHFPESISIFDEITEDICRKYSELTFIDPYYEDFVVKNYNINFDTLCLEEREDLGSFLIERRMNSFFQEQLVAYHLKVLIDLLKEIGWRDPSNGIINYLKNIKQKVQSGKYKTHPNYIELLRDWLP